MSTLIRMILISSLCFSCAFFKGKEKKEETSAEPTLTDAEEFGADPTMSETTAEEPQTVTSETEANMEPEAMTSDSIAAAPVVEESADSYAGGGEKTYTVKKNETLMMVAFNLYGDYEKWKEIASRNQDILKGSNRVKSGMVLKYDAPAQEFVWNPEGNPYLIKNGDTLGGISGQVYNNRNKWRSIWDNNKPLIKNPNKIFAGFTIYYLDLDKVATSYAP